jgi:hypothetical protein
MPATGKAFEMEAMYMVRVNEQGQIAEHWGVVDTIGTMGQLGLLPAPDQTPPGRGRPLWVARRRRILPGADSPSPSWPPGGTPH